MLAWYSKIVVGATLILIFFGALVKSHEAGLAVPDWPTSYGHNMFLFPPSQWIGGIFYEHVHRLIASGIGLLTIILTVGVWRSDRRVWMRGLAVLALAMVIVQGLLGGLTVIYKLPDVVSVAHGVLAQTFLLVTIAIAFGASRTHAESKAAEDTPERRRVFRMAVVALVLVYAQLVVGAVMRHAEAGMALRDFPTMGGTLLPSVDEAFLAQVNAERSSLALPAVNAFQVSIHIAHRLLALLVLAAILYLWFRGRTLLPEHQRRPLYALGCLILVQFTLGALTILSGRMPYVASVHVLLGAVSIGATFLLVLQTAPFLKRKGN